MECPVPVQPSELGSMPFAMEAVGAVFDVQGQPEFSAAKSRRWSLSREPAEEQPEVARSVILGSSPIASNAIQEAFRLTKQSRTAGPRSRIVRMWNLSAKGPGALRHIRLLSGERLDP